jgi:glucose-1-phosphate thymidylyltransferase
VTRKGIVLAGGAGTRLHPITLTVSKQLLPLYDKPMIYYPLATLMDAGIRDILIITTPDDSERFRALLGDGSSLGIRLRYAAQARPEGVAQAFLIGRDFIGSDPVALILGDNLLFGDGVADRLRAASRRESGATIFGCAVADPRRFGVLELDADGAVLTIEEKPAEPRSPYANVGVYFYDADVVAIAGRLTPSARGELEITDVNLAYLRRGDLIAELLGPGTTWLDTGTHDSLLRAANAIQSLQSRDGTRVGCIEEVAFRRGYIDRAQLLRLAEPLHRNDYGRHLLALAGEVGGPA